MLFLYAFVFYIKHKQLETHGCVISIAATDGPVLKHPAISSNSADLAL